MQIPQHILTTNPPAEVPLTTLLTVKAEIQSPLPGYVDLLTDEEDDSDLSHITIGTPDTDEDFD